MTLKVTIPEEAGAPQGDALLNTLEAANRIKLATGTLANARVTGALNLPFIKLGAGKRAPIRYRKSDLDAWLDERTFKNTQQAFVSGRNVERA